MVKPATKMMSYQNPPSIDDDETSIPLVTTILPSTTTTTMTMTTTMGHRWKWMLSIALVAGMKMMLMVTYGAVVLPEGASYPTAAEGLMVGTHGNAVLSSGQEILQPEGASYPTAAEGLMVGTHGNAVLSSGQEILQPEGASYPTAAEGLMVGTHGNAVLSSGQEILQPEGASYTTAAEGLMVGTHGNAVLSSGQEILQPEGASYTTAAEGLMVGTHGNAVLSSGQEILHYCVQGVMKECSKGECPDDYPDIKRGMCETTGSYNDVLPYLDHRKIIPGKIYYGLNFTDDIYAGYTYTPHNAPFPEHVDYADYPPSCEWGDGKIVGSCMKYRNASGGRVLCPSPQRQIVHAWQRCAERCNDQPECHTFTVRTNWHGGRSTLHRPFRCYFHKSYECKSNHAGIDNYKIHRNIQYSKDDDLGVWGGICRTRSGRTKDYACTNTPHP